MNESSLSSIVQSVVNATRGVRFNGPNSELSYIGPQEFSISIRLREEVTKGTLMLEPLALTYQVKVKVPVTGDDQYDEEKIMRKLGSAIRRRRNTNIASLTRWLGYK